MQTVDLPLSYTASFFTQPWKTAAHPLSSTKEGNIFGVFVYVLRLWKSSNVKRKKNRIIPIEHSPEHVGRAEHHIKLPAVEARGLLRHLCRFQQP